MRFTIEQLVITVAVLILMTATLDDFGMAWDEGYAIECAERVREWFGRIAGDSSPGSRAWSPTTSLLEPRARYLASAGRAAASPWSRESLRFHWPFAREEPIGHPPFFALLELAGWTISHRLLPPPASYRFGSAALFAVTIGALYGFMARRYGRLAGAMAAVGLLTMPRVFAHAHFASFDSPTLCLWFLAVAAYARAVGPPAGEWAWAWTWTVVFGVLAGCAAATKFTGWLLPIPLAAWALAYRDRHAARVLVIGCVVATAVVYALIPTWWTEPIGGVRVFLQSNLTRRQHSAIPTQFLGRIHAFSLPWYNTLVWTAIVVPPATLALALVGVGSIVAGRLRDRVGVLLLICWAFFLVLRALPAAPGHDSERQFLPAFAFAACLAGVGAEALSSFAANRFPPRVAGMVAPVAIVAAALAGGYSTWLYHPLQLSYYNSFIRGLPGASRAGMEPTYYWDSLTPDVREWLNAHTDPGLSVMFAYPVASMEYLYHWGLLKPSPIPDQAHPPRWYVVQNRPGILCRYPNLRLAEALLRHDRPVLMKTARAAPEVPLLAIFSVDQALAREKRMLEGTE